MAVGRLPPERLLVGLTLLALILRLWALGSMPPGLDTDEAAIGYNAYSLLRSGRDEYGQPWPLLFESFGEWKRPVYIYAAVPAVAALGLNPFAVRLPAALAGALSVPVLYAVARLLLRGPRRALLAAGLLAISPWHLQFTRAAREVSVLLLALLVLVWALLAAVHAPRDRPRGGPFLLGAAMAFLAATHTYTAGIILAPLLSLAVGVAYRSRLSRLPRAWLVAAGAVLVLGAVPLGRQFADGRAGTRFAMASVFADKELQATAAGRVERDERDGLPAVLSGPVLLGVWRAAGGYVAHFEPSFLFVHGDGEWRHHSSTGGLLLLWDVPLLICGALVALRHRRRPAVRVVVAWLAVGPLPAAFGSPAPHAVRSIAMLPALYLLAALGLGPVWRWIAPRRLNVDWAAALVLCVAVYLYGYYRYYGYEHDGAWSSGWLETFRAAQREVDSGRYTRVVIPEDLPTPRVAYIYALFGTAYSPERYLAQGGTRSSLQWRWYPEPGPMAFEPFELRAVDWSQEPRNGETLYVYPPDRRLPDGTEPVVTIKRTGGSGRDALRLIAYVDPA
jgi:4-amino-4-deoxy-L-arabinose transferase-like glycosyltransferase